ncbi:MAG: hypothetical protein HRU06_14305 [Oceanospirillaceae bacterium]|nr:hypothetical protein [Oceanospirillaceae bacterium]
MFKVVFFLLSCFSVAAIAESLNPPLAVGGKSNVKINQSEFLKLNKSVGEWFINCRQKFAENNDNWHCVASNNVEIRTYDVYGDDPFTLFSRLNSRLESKAVWLRSSVIEKSVEKPLVSAIEEPVDSVEKVLIQGVAVVNQEPGVPVKVEVVAVESLEEVIVPAKHPLAQESLVAPQQVITQSETVKAEKFEVRGPLFAVQLAAFTTREEALHFMSQARVSKLMIRQTKLNGLHWYNVVMKELVSVEQSASVEKFVQQRTGQRPWVREYSDF